jgi:putative ABC transport system ATP-binding protein
MSNSIIECVSLEKRYKRKNNSFTALSDINLKVTENESLLIKGRSGAGKSTLIHLMCGLLKPTSGKVYYKGIEISDSDNSVLSRFLLNDAGIIFQNFNLLPTYSVYENIEIGIFPKNTDPEKNRSRIMDYLQQFDLADKTHLFPTELSVGQQQKVAVIRTLIKEPSVIFADEPTGSVDDQSASEILEQLLKLKSEKKITLIMATHGNISDNYADRIIELENGRIKS